jgi:hypothetical protein
MEIHSIKDIPNSFLTKLDILAKESCQAGKFSFIKLKELATNTDVAYMFDKKTDTLVYFLLLDLFHKHKTVYIHDVCVNTLYRGKSLFKKSLSILKKYYSTKGFTTFTLDASDSTKEEGLDQKARIHIFHSAGFDVNTETGYFTKEGDYIIMKTSVLVDNNKIVEIQRKEGSTYSVKDDDGKEYTVGIDQIEKCFDAKLNPIPCPMIMNISVKGGHTRRKRKRT